MGSPWILERGSSFVDQFYDFYPHSSLETTTFSHLTWIPESAVGPATEYSVANCRLKKVRSSGERQVNDLMSDHFSVWVVPADGLPVDGDGNVIPPVPADWIIRADGTKWNLLSVVKQLMGACYNCSVERFE